MNVLLTGAFGNVGVSTLEELLQQGHRVRCFDLRTPANERTARHYRDRIEVMWGDLRHPQEVAAAVVGQDVVIHVAFIIPKMSATGIESEQQPALAEAVNIGGTRNLVRAMQQQPVPPRLIFTSSLHVYGRTQDLPPPRTVAETPHPIEHYARHKLACEQMIRTSGLTWAILRLAATFPIALKLDPGMFDVPLANRMEYVHTRDVGLALANAVSSDDIWGKTLLIGGGPRCQHIFGDMVARIMAALGLPMLPQEAFATVPFATDWLDTAESERLLHYQTRTLDDFLRDMVRLMGPRAQFVRLFRPVVRRSLLQQSVHWRRKVAGARTRQPAWAGKVALITGASGGIGAAVARGLAQQGLRVALVGRRVERLDLLADEIRRDGGQAHVIAADLTDEGERQRVIEAADALGELEVLVNCAGFGWYGFGSDMAWPVAAQMIQTNLAAVAHLTLLALPAMRARNSGHIINIGSISGSLPMQGIAVYSATKSFVDSFTTALYRELVGTHIKVSVVRPGPVRTEFFDRSEQQAGGRRIPAERFAVTPEAVGRKVARLLRRPRRVAYVPGWLGFVPWVEPLFGGLIDRLGPLLLRRSASTRRQVRGQAIGPVH